MNEMLSRSQRFEVRNQFSKIPKVRVNQPNVLSLLDQSEERFPISAVLPWTCGELFS